MKHLLFILFVAISLLICCKENSVESTPNPITCISSNGCGKIYQACCSSTNCYYTYNGKRYDCDGINCNAAAQRLVHDMCGTSYKQFNEPLSTTEQEALRLTKILIKTDTLCAVCLQK
jgi:hypothetical protein